MNALFNGSAIQKKSAGSVLATTSLSQTYLKSNLGLIPNPQDSQNCCTYKNDLSVSALSFGALGIYNFVFFQDWMAGLGWGVELGSQKIEQSLDSSASFQSFAKNKYLLNFGYQGKNFYALLYFLENKQQVSATQIDSITFGNTDANFILGYYL